MSSISCLPEYLRRDVLARLPLKSFLQIRAVYKSWCALIDSQEFVKLHLNRSIMDGKAQKIIWSQSDRSSHSLLNGIIWKLYTAEFDAPKKFRRTAAEVRYPFWRFQVGDSYVMCSCNGLLFVKNSKFGMFLWNLSTRKYWKLPRIPLGLDFSERRELEIRYGFGYDDTSNDYKVVKMVGVKHKGSQPRCYEAKPLIFELRSTAFCNYWSSLKIFHGALRPWTDASAWFCCNRNDPDNPSMVQMWVMKDYRKEDSWSKLTLEIPADNPYPNLFPIAYSDCNRRKLLFETHLEKALWYDTETGSIQKTGILGSQCMHTLFPYVSSLVQPCGGRSKQIKKFNKLQKEARKRGRV